MTGRLPSRRSLPLLALGAYWMHLDPNGQDWFPPFTTIQYPGNKERDFLALLRSILEHATHIAAFPVEHPCADCAKGIATLKSVDISDRTEMAADQANALRKLLAASDSYSWTMGVLGSNYFAPDLGFYFASNEPLAVFVVESKGYVGIGQLLLPIRPASSSLSFVALTKASTAAIVSIYSSSHKGSVR